MPEKTVSMVTPVLPYRHANPPFLLDLEFAGTLSRPRAKGDPRNASHPVVGWFGPWPDAAGVVGLRRSRSAGTGRGGRRGRLRHGLSQRAAAGAAQRVSAPSARIRLLLGRRLLGLDRLRLVLEHGLVGAGAPRVHLRAAALRLRGRA